MYTFEVTILGASGGPDGGPTQCFMVRPYGYEGVNSVCVDGGAGSSQITQMIARYGGSTHDEMIESFYLNDMEPSKKFFDARTAVGAGFPSFLATYLHGRSATCNTRMKALELYCGMKEYYITHPHLDHILGMILNSPLIFEGESCVGAAKEIWGLPFTIDAIQKHIFNDVIWPDLVTGGESRFQLRTLSSERSHSCATFPGWYVTPLQVHHGFGAFLKNQRVYSTVYLFSNRETKDSVLICGDIEADFSLGDKKSLFHKVLKYISEEVPQNKLKGIIIECSSSMAVSEGQLYGHLSPRHLIKVLCVLRELYGDSNALKGLDVIITHVKSVTTLHDPRLIILSELRGLARQNDLHDVKFSIAIQGYTFRF